MPLAELPITSYFARLPKQPPTKKKKPGKRKRTEDTQVAPSTSDASSSKRPRQSLPSTSQQTPKAVAVSPPPRKRKAVEFAVDVTAFLDKASPSNDFPDVPSSQSQYYLDNSFETSGFIATDAVPSSQSQYYPVSPVRRPKPETRVQPREETSVKEPDLLDVISSQTQYWEDPMVASVAGDVVFEQDIPGSRENERSGVQSSPVMPRASGIELADLFELPINASADESATESESESEDETDEFETPAAVREFLDMFDGDGSYPESFPQSLQV